MHNIFVESEAFMGGYNSKEFTKTFSKRTICNLEHIFNITQLEDVEKKAREQFLEKYNLLIDELDDITTQIRRDAGKIQNKGKGKNPLRKRMYSVAQSLETEKKTMENRVLDVFKAANEFSSGKLYEVTQLLNSLMGIAVLPFEMHREYIKTIDKSIFSDDNSKKREYDRGMSCNEADTVANPYEELYIYINNLYNSGKCYTSYPTDLFNGQEGVLYKKNLVFSFLYHVRNAACHSGNGGLSILPLDDGKVINNILFYDQNTKKGHENEEFAMQLTLDELQEVVKLISNFYNDDTIGKIDKTSKIEEVEKNVNNRLEDNPFKKVDGSNSTQYKA